MLPLSEDEFLVADTRERITFRPLADGTVELVYEALAGNPVQADGLAVPAVAPSTS